MGLSLANTVALHLRRRTPRVVIRGGFALGLTRHDSVYTLYLSPSVRLVGLAEAVSGSTFRFEVRGRNGLSPYVSGDMQSITQPSSYSPHPWGNDYPSMVRMTTETTSQTSGYYVASSSDGMKLAEEEAFGDNSTLGTLVAPDVQIVIHGSLSSLDLSKIRASGFIGDSAGSVPTTGGGWWTSSHRCLWPDGTYHNGWRTFDVHVFDNPQLRGHVSGSYSGLFWYE